MPDIPAIAVLVIVLLVLLLAAAIATAAIRGRAQARRAEQALDAVREQARLEAARAANSHSRNLEDLTRTHRTAQAAVEAQLAEQRGRAEAYRDAAVAAIGWDLASRDDILRACEHLGLTGVVASNILFLAPDHRRGESFACQVDHVVLTQRTAILIEHKRWRGVVLDGQLPSSVNPELAALIPDPALGDESPDFAIRARPREGAGVDVAVHAGTESPRHQARTQAARLADALRERGLTPPYLHTLVYYSNPHAIVHAAGPSERAGTIAVAGRAALEDALSALGEERPRAGDPPMLLAPVFAEWGADLVGFGAEAAHWTSPLPSGVRPRTARV